MALTQGARNKIKSFVQSAKRLLMKEFAGQIQQYYGIAIELTLPSLYELKLLALVLCSGFIIGITSSLSS